MFIVHKSVTYWRIFISDAELSTFTIEQECWPGLSKLWLNTLYRFLRFWIGVGGGILGEGTCWCSKLPVWRFFWISTGSNRSLNGSCVIHCTLPSFWVRNGHFGHNGLFSDHIFSRSTYWRFQSCETGCSVCNLQKKINERSLQIMPLSSLAN